MNASQIEILRNCLLRQLSSALPASLTSEILSLGLTAAGLSPTQAQLDAELLYLVQRNFVETSFKTLNASTTRYRLSAEGRDYLQKENLL